MGATSWRCRCTGLCFLGGDFLLSLLCQVLKPGASSGRARAVGGTERNAPGFPPPRAGTEGRREAGRKESLSQTDTRVQSIWILLCFNLCGRRHMQRWFCSCTGGSRRAARVHRRSAFQAVPFSISNPSVGNAQQQQSTEAAGQGGL